MEKNRDYDIGWGSNVIKRSVSDYERFHLFFDSRSINCFRKYFFTGTGEYRHEKCDP